MKLRLSSVFSVAGLFALAFILCLFAAYFAVSAIEETSRNAVRDTLDENGMTWTEVDADGLQVYLAGTAPSEATRFRALSIAGSVVESARIIDQMLVEDTAGIEPPRFSVEILRNDRGISLIGLVPASMDRDQLILDVARRTGDQEITDLLESADYPQPDTWEDALDFAVRSLDDLIRAKISVDAARIEVTAMAESEEDKINLETDLARRLPDGLRLALDISAPRPVVTPFTLRYTIADGTGKFDVCAADTENARERILRAAGRNGLNYKAQCTLALGVPSPNWADAAELAIDALGEIGDGSVTFSDADISLVAAYGTSEPVFDAVIGRLETSLPDVFALHAVLPVPEAENALAPEFVATLSPEGLVQVRGRVESAQARETIDSLAKARFGSDVVHTTARVAENLPRDWAVRTLTAVEALAHLSNGAVTVSPDLIDITGQTGRKDAEAAITGLLAQKLGEREQYSINVSYQEALDPVASLPTPDECEAQIAQIQVERKITFAPGETSIDDFGAAIMDDIAEIIRSCGEIRMEIGGHTDSQGREIMNEQLSQARAQTILNELRSRKVLTASISAKGYGESQPIAENDTEEGREANRRIEFRIIRPEPIVEKQTTLEAMEEEAQNVSPEPETEPLPEDVEPEAESATE